METVTAGVGALQLEEAGQEEVPQQKVTWRDVLMTVPTNASVAARPAAEAVVKEERKPWAPVFQVVRMPCLIQGKAYGVKADFDGGDGDEDGIWDLLDSYAHCKHAASVSRTRSISMLTPMQAEKKALRIGQREQMAVASD